MADGDENAGGESRQDLAQQLKQLEEDVKFGEEKKKYLRETLEKEIVRGKPRLRLMLEFKAFLMFIIIFTLYVLLTRADINNLELVEGLEDALIQEPIPKAHPSAGTKLRDVGTIAEWYDWLTYVVIPAATENFGESTQGRRVKYMAKYGHINMYNKVMHSIRIRQIRVQQQNCSIVTGNLLKHKRYSMPCFREYSSDDEETRPWQGYTWNSAGALGNDVFGTNPNRLQIFTEDSFPGSGYVHDIVLNASKTNLQKEAQQLRASGWINKQSRAVIVEFVTFNPNINIYIDAGILCQKTIAGRFVCSPRFRTFVINKYDFYSAFSWCLLMLQILIYVFTCYFTIEQLVQMAHPNLKRELEHHDAAPVGGMEEDVLEVVPYYWRPIVYLQKFKDGWEILHVANIVTFIIQLYWRMLWHTNTSVKAYRLEDHLQRFINCYPYARWQAMENDMVAFNVIITYGKLFKFMRLKQELNVMWLTLTNSWELLAGFTVMTLIIFSGFAFMGFVIYGSSLRDYYTIAAAMSTLFEMLLGQFNYEAMKNKNTTMTGIFFYIYMFLVVLILINMFIAILQDSYNDVSATLKEIPPPKQQIGQVELWFGKSAQHAWDDFEAWATDNQDEMKAHASDSEDSDVEEAAQTENVDGEAEDTATIHAGESENGNKSTPKET